MSGGTRLGATAGGCFQHSSALANWMVSVAEPLELPASVTLFRQGARAGQIYYVQRGSVKIVHDGPTGGRIILRASDGPTFLGVASALLAAPQPAAAVTRTPVVMHSVCTSAMEQALAEDERISSEVRLILASEVVHHAELLGAIGCLSARERLARLLLDRLQQPGSRISAEDLAGLIATDISHLHRLLRELKKLGVITLASGYVRVLDAAALACASGLQLENPSGCFLSGSPLVASQRQSGRNTSRSSEPRLSAIRTR